MIGILDPAVGGLTLLRKLSHRLPGYPIRYLGDTAREPYDHKSPEIIREYARSGAAQLVRMGARYIVLADACQAAWARSVVEDAFRLPVYEPLTSAARLAVQASKSGTIGAIGPQTLVESECLEEMIQAISATARVWSRSVPLLPALVEEGRLRKPETAMIVKKYLHPLKTRQVDTLILCSAHHLLIRDLIQRKIGRRVRLVEPFSDLAETIAGAVLKDGGQSIGERTPAEPSVFLTDDNRRYRELANLFYGKNIHIEKWVPGGCEGDDDA